jgi:hypothetical protein
MSRPFEHLGVLYAGPEQLVGAILPTLDAALDDGRSVITVVDRRTTAMLREALDERAARVVFRAPSELLRPGPERLVAEVRARTPRSGEGPVVVGQYQGFTTEEDAAFWEAAAALVLDDERLTLLCACARGADPAVVEVARQAHGTLLTAGGRITNPAARVPADRSPTPSSMWGRRVLRLAFRGPADLGRVRERVARAAGAAGLGADRTAAAVLAVHEAALYVCGGREAADGCTLEIRESDLAVLTELTGPGPAAPGGDPVPLRYVELFSDAATLGERDGRPAVRVLSTGGPTAGVG